MFIFREKCVIFLLCFSLLISDICNFCGRRIFISFKTNLISNSLCKIGSLLNMSVCVVCDFSAEGRGRKNSFKFYCKVKTQYLSKSVWFS